MLDEETGNVKVVDFGAVQDAASVMVTGSTVVGTVRFSCSTRGLSPSPTFSVLSLVYPTYIW